MNNYLYAQFQLSGVAEEDSLPYCYILTPDTTFNAGAIWDSQLVDIRQAFDIYAKIYLGARDEGADGLAFVLQQATADIVGNGGSLGYSGLSPSIALEFDTYQNIDYGDSVYDHIALMSNGIGSHLAGSQLSASVPILTDQNNMPLNAEDNQFHDIHISWNPQIQEFQVSVDCVVRLTYTGDIINNIFNGDPFTFWGFTAATGGERNLHKVCIDYSSFIDQLKDTTICQGASVPLNAGTGEIFSWTPSIGLDNDTIANPIAKPTITTQYIVTVTDSCGNTRTDSALITVSNSILDGNGENICLIESNPGEVLSNLQLWLY